MLIVMRHGAATEEVERVVATIESLGYQARPMPGAQRTAVGLVGNDGRVDAGPVAGLDGAGVLSAGEGPEVVGPEFALGRKVSGEGIGSAELLDAVTAADAKRS